MDQKMLVGQPNLTRPLFWPALEVSVYSQVSLTFLIVPLSSWMLFLYVAGGTFALYSLICRHAKVSLLPNQLASDTRISSFRLKVPSAELERSLKIKEYLETSLSLKKLVLVLVLAGTSMVIADGVVTPAMSGLFLNIFFFFLWKKDFYLITFKNYFCLNFRLTYYCLLQ